MRPDRTSPRDAARIALLFLKVGTMNELQYRANFVIQLVQSLLAVGTGLVVLALVYGRTDELGGWSRPQLLAVMGVYTIVGGLVRAVVQPNMQRLLDDIRLGTLDYVLTKPEDGQVLVSVREVRVWQAADVLVGFVVLAVAIVQMGTTGWVGAVLFLGMLVLGSVTIYCFWLLLASAGFWLVRMEEAQELFTGVYRAGQYPVGIYPGWLRFGLTFLVPLAFAITVPSEAAADRLRASTVLTAVIATIALACISRFVFRRGLRRYSGASA
jgi:ABC-2 type transport system permease protein